MKNYLVIGGSSGIGRAIAENLEKEGHNVYATYCKNPLQSNGVAYHYLDVRENEFDLEYLPDTLHGLAYCPGSINLAPFHRIKPDAFAGDFELQVNGAVKVLQAVQKKLKAAGHASVVFFSTVAVQSGFNFHAQVAASKGAIEGLTRSLAAEWAPGIRVNAIAPSLTDTPLAEKLLNSDAKKEANAQRHPMKRIGSAEDIAETAAFLLTDRSSWMTGQVLHVDGGMSRLKV
jgi:NAD(P)-dependent dehydrogenase (short-subunit alcohol dehydrogenase family)